MKIAEKSQVKYFCKLMKTYSKFASAGSSDRAKEGPKEKVSRLPGIG